MQKPISGGHDSVSATQIVRDFPEVRRLAENGPIFITSHGRNDSVLLSMSDFTSLESTRSSQSDSLDRKLALVLDAIEEYVLILDEDLRIFQTNRFASECFAIPADELIGRPLASLIRSPSNRFMLQRLSEVLQSGQAEVVTIPSPNDERRVVRATMRPWPGGVALFAIDITEGEKLKDRKIADGARDIALEAAGGVGLADVQSNGAILSASTALASMVGASEVMLEGSRLQHLLDPSSRASVNDALSSNSSASQILNVRYLRHGTDVMAADLSIAPYWTAEHHACAAIALIDRAYASASEKRQSSAA